MPRTDNRLRSRAFYILKNRHPDEYDEIYNEQLRQEVKPPSRRERLEKQERLLLQLLWKYHPEPDSVMRPYQFYGNKIGLSMEQTRKAFGRLVEKELATVDQIDRLERKITLLGWL